MPFGWSEAQEGYHHNYNDGQPNEAEFSHEAVVGGAAFAGFKAFEDHQRAEGKTVNHAFAKEVLAGLAGAEVDRLAETKGMDEYDRLAAKRDAKEHAEYLYTEHYEKNLGADQYSPDLPEPEHLRRHRERR